MQKHNNHHSGAENYRLWNQASTQNVGKIENRSQKSPNLLLRTSSALVALGAVLMLSHELQAACTPTPDCAALGYTQTSCPNGGVKCPWNTSKMFCKEDNSLACSTLPMAVGDILYSDKTYCSPDVHNALITAGQAVKTPIGIVSYINGSKRLAIQLTNPGTMLWSNGYTDIPGITNYSSSPHTTDFSGKSNTAAWVSYYGSNVSNYAPGYCYNYTTAGTVKGDWYLPAQGELYASIWTNKSKVNSGLGKVSGGATLIDGWHWSSSENAYNYDAWIVNANNGDTGNGNKGGSSYVRCVLAF